MLLSPACAVPSGWTAYGCCLLAASQSCVPRQDVSKVPAPSGLSSAKKRASFAVSLDPVLFLATQLYVLVAALLWAGKDPSRNVAAS